MARPRARRPRSSTTLNKAFNAALADANVKARLADLGGIEMEPNTPAEFGKFIAADTDKWRKVVQFAHLKPE